MKSFQEKFEQKINTFFSSIRKDLITIGSDYIQLSDIDSAETSILFPNYAFKYEKGVSLSANGLYVFEKNGCRISIEIVYPEVILGSELEPPIISATVNGKRLSGMIFVMAEKTPHGDNFVTKVKEIITGRLYRLEQDLCTKILCSW